MMYEWNVTANVYITDPETGVKTTETVFFITIGKTREEAMINAVQTLRLEMGYMAGKILELKKIFPQ